MKVKDFKNIHDLKTDIDQSDDCLAGLWFLLGAGIASVVWVLLAIIGVLGCFKFVR